MLDPRIEAIRAEYGLPSDSFWELPQKKGTWLVKHSALETVAAKARIVFDPPQIIEANGGAGIAAVCVRGTLGDRSVWSIGECNPKNNKNAYPWAMAEKRAIDRVILKLAGIHGLVYSEEEMAGEDRTSPPQPTTVPQLSSYRAKQLLKTDVLLEEIDKAKDVARCDELEALFNTELSFLPAKWVQQFIDRIEQRRDELAKPSAAELANQTLDRQFAETIGK